MHFDILTLFPDMFEGPFRESILKRAIDRGLFSVSVRDIRDYTTDRHRTADDYPFGGGRGMVMKPEPVFAAVEAVLAAHGKPPPGWPVEVPAPIPRSRVVLMSPQGRLLRQEIARRLSQEEHLVIICGHYEGVDERVREHLVDDEISIGDYVLTGGELPAMVLVDCVARLLPGVLPAEATAEESHAEGLLEYPQYTRPADFRGLKVPEVLLSGHHAAIARWRRCQSLLRTLQRRPDLLSTAPLSAEDRRLVEQIERTTREGGSPCG